MNDPLPEQKRPSPILLAWLLGLSILAAACVVAWLLAARMDSPFSAACVLIAAVGWVLCRSARASTPGVVLWCVSVAAMNWAIPSLIHTEIFWEIPLVLVALLPLPSGIVFLVAAARNRTRQVANCGGCVLALFTLITWIMGVSTIHDALHMQGDAQETTRTLATAHKLAQDVESIRARLGRLPKDEEELVQLRGKPMPTFGLGHYPIHYYRSSDLDYQLNFSFRSFWGYRWDIFGYVASYYGPNATPRLFVDLF